MKTIESLVLENLIYNEEFTRKVLPYLSKEFFHDRTHGIVYSEIKEFFSLYNLPPTKEAIEISLNELTQFDVIKGEAGNDTLVIVGDAADYNMWEDNTSIKEAFNSISTVETLAFGSSNASYTVSGTKTIKLAKTVQSTGIRTIDASNATGGGSDALIINAFQFSSASQMNFIGSDDKDVNVHFTGGSGDDTLTTGKICEDEKDTLTGGLGIDTFNMVATDIEA